AVIGVDGYLLLLLVSVVRRSDRRRMLFELPDSSYSLAELFLLLAGVICAFGALYLESGGVVHLSKDLDADSGTGATSRGELLTHKGAACYFSLVTITTLGFGDYVPATKQARRLVMWEVMTGVLLFLFALPLVVSRLANFDS